jgi:hypothetical protein
MLLNLSNHPSPIWGDMQKAEAERLFGAVADLPFPAIPPEADASEIEKLAEQYCEKVVGFHPAALHVMGELTFCLCLVARLQKLGFPCFASTTKRRVSEENADGKTSHFSFVRFRLYPQLC